MEGIVFEDEPDVANRFKLIIDRYFGTPKEFCARTGINRGTVSMFLNRKRIRVGEIITQSIIAVCPDIPVEWIQHGVDPRLVQETTKQQTIDKLEAELAIAKKQIERLEGIIDIILEKRNRS